MNKINLKVNPAVDDNELTKQQYLILKAELSRLRNIYNMMLSSK